MEIRYCGYLLSQQNKFFFHDFFPRVMLTLAKTKMCPMWNLRSGSRKDGIEHPFWYMSLVIRNGETCLYPNIVFKLVLGTNMLLSCTQNDFLTILIVMGVSLYG